MSLKDNRLGAIKQTYLEIFCDFHFSFGGVKFCMNKNLNLTPSRPKSESANDAACLMSFHPKLDTCVASYREKLCRKNYLILMNLLNWQQYRYTYTLSIIRWKSCSKLQFFSFFKLNIADRSTKWKQYRQRRTKIHKLN